MSTDDKAKRKRLSERGGRRKPLGPAASPPEPIERDPRYLEWRRRQIAEFGREYEEYDRRERENLDRSGGRGLGTSDVRERAQSEYDLGEEKRSPTAGSVSVAAVSTFLGGDRVLGSTPDDPLQAHDLLVAGIAGEALDHVVRSVELMPNQELFEQGLGMSLRTYQRRREVGDKPLSPEQSGRLWKFAEILLQAAELLGSREEAEAWLARPAVGLSQRRPIDLLASPVGVALVEEHLGRLRHGVYA